MNKRDLIILGVGVIAGFAITKLLLSGDKKENKQDGDSEYFAFADGGVKLGDKGADVNRLKNIVNHFGYSLPIDGLYNRETRYIITRVFDGTSVMNNRRKEGEIDVRFIDNMEKIFENVKK